MKERIVLAYSGGLRSSAALAWLLDQRRAEVVAVTLDLGQGGELPDVRERALAAGAARCHVLDVREEFVRDFGLPVLQAGAFARRPAGLAIALTRPLIARTLVEIARMESSTTVAHGAAGQDGAALASCFRALDARLTVVAPPGVPTAAAALGAPPSSAAADGSWEIGATLWGRALTGGSADPALLDRPDDLFMLTRPALEAPDQPANVEIAFERGVPSAINGIAMWPRELVDSLSTIAGAHGVGREDRDDAGPRGQRTRTIHEAPAATVLHLAHEALEAFVSPPELSRFKPSIAGEYESLVSQGLWYSPLREACGAFVAKAQERVTGTVRLTLFRGSARVAGCARQSATGIEGPLADARAAEAATGPTR